jgi:hypothetical protein
MGIGNEEAQNDIRSNIAIALVQTVLVPKESVPILIESVFFFNETSFLAAILIRQKSSARPPRKQYIPQGPNVNDDTFLGWKPENWNRPKI